MRNGNLTLATLVSLFCAIGCGGDPMEDMESMTEEICACEDKECAEDVKESYEGKHDKDDLEELSEEDKKKMVGLALKAAGCMMKLEE